MALSTTVAVLAKGLGILALGLGVLGWLFIIWLYFGPLPGFGDCGNREPVEASTNRVPVHMHVWLSAETIPNDGTLTVRFTTTNIGHDSLVMEKDDGPVLDLIVPAYGPIPEGETVRWSDQHPEDPRARRLALEPGESTTIELHYTPKHVRDNAFQLEGLVWAAHLTSRVPRGVAGYEKVIERFYVGRRACPGW
jgi:hypothetical protein